jgi:outer membrane protein assembly factor BamB
MLAAVWGSPFVVDGKVMLGDEDGDLTILEASRQKRLIDEFNFGNTVYSTPVVANGTLYIMTRSHVYAIEAP